MENKICPRCKSKNDIDANFCEICGCKLNRDYEEHKAVIYKVNFAGEIKIEKIQ